LDCDCTDPALAQYDIDASQLSPADGTAERYLAVEVTYLGRVTLTPVQLDILLEVGDRCSGREARRQGRGVGGLVEAPIVSHERAKGRASPVIEASGNQESKSQQREKPLAVEKSAAEWMSVETRRPAARA